MKKSAIILAGGKGTRLQSVVNELPKPMAPVAAKPFLWYLLSWLNNYGYQEVVLSVGYMHNKISSVFGESFGSMQIKYAIEETPLGTGGGIVLAEQMLENDRYTLLNGDSMILVDLDQMAQTFENHRWQVLICSRHMLQPARYGTLELDDNRIQAFAEKDPRLAEGWINAGLYMLTKGLLPFKTGEAFSFEQDFLETSCNKVKMGVFKSGDYFIDIGIPEDYFKAQHDFPKLFN